MILGGGLRRRLPITATRFCDIMEKSLGKGPGSRRFFFNIPITCLKFAMNMISLLAGQSNFFREPHLYLVVVAGHYAWPVQGLSASAERMKLEVRGSRKTGRTGPHQGPSHSAACHLRAGAAAASRVVRWPRRFSFLSLRCSPLTACVVAVAGGRLV